MAWINHKAGPGRSAAIQRREAILQPRFIPNQGLFARAASREATGVHDRWIYRTILRKAMNQMKTEGTGAVRLRQRVIKGT